MIMIMIIIAVVVVIITVVVVIITVVNSVAVAAPNYKINPMSRVTKCSVCMSVCVYACECA